MIIFCDAVMMILVKCIAYWLADTRDNIESGTDPVVSLPAEQPEE